MRLWRLQCAIYFRGVSVPSDEPLCIATLLALEISNVYEVKCAQQRMARIWELVAKAAGGIPPRMIFFVNEPLQLPKLTGWRWAPKTLLSPTFGSGLRYENKADRFGVFDLTVSSGGDFPLGIPTELGFKVVFPGFALTARP